MAFTETLEQIVPEIYGPDGLVDKPTVESMIAEVNASSSLRTELQSKSDLLGLFVSLDCLEEMLTVAMDVRAGGHSLSLMLVRLIVWVLVERSSRDHVVKILVKTFLETYDQDQVGVGVVGTLACSPQ